MSEVSPPLCEPPRSPPRLPRVPLPVGSWDTHVHVFGSPEAYPLDPGRNYTPRGCTLAQYREVMVACGIANAVLVQPSVYGTDNRCLLDALRDGGAAFRGIAVPRADATAAELEAMHVLGVRGIRLNLVNPQIVGLDAAVALCDRIAPLGWHLQVQVRWGEAAQALVAQLVRRTGVPIVIDHLGRPETMQATAALLELLASGRGWVKLSAPYRLREDAHAPYDDVLPLVHALVAANPQRVLWATDWPHSERFTATPHDADLVDLLPAWLPDPALRRRVCVDNPAALYGP